MSAIRRRRTVFATSVVLLMAATNLAANWGDRAAVQADRDEVAALKAAESYVRSALSRDDIAARHVAPHFAGDIPVRMSMADTLRVACHLVDEGDRRYHRYLELVQVRVRMQAQSQRVPQRLSEELEALRAPPMQPKHLVRSSALLAACESDRSPVVASLNHDRSVPAS